MAAIWAFHVWFQGRGLEGDTPQPGSVVAGCLATMSISLLWSAGGVLRHRRLLRDAVTGAPPVDGRWAGFSGVIRSSSPLTSPLSRTRAVAFKYRIHEMKGTGKHRHSVAHYEGTALAASTISTSLGSYKLLAVPNFDLSHHPIEASVARRNAEIHIAETPFETRATAPADRQTVMKEWTDDDGVFRRDRKGTDEVDLADCQFDEQVIAQGEQVCVLGLYSQARGGIIPDPNWARQMQVIRGDGEAGIRQLGARAGKYTFSALIFAAAASFICWAVITGRWTP